VRAMVLTDGETFSGVAGCKIVDLADSLEGDDVDAAVKDGDCVVLVVFDGSEGPALPERPVFSAPERERICALLEEHAALHQRLSTLSHATEAEQAVYARDAELIRRVAAVL
jgi:hypothetical protein